MKFNCEKNVLQTAISISSRAAATKSPNPALEGILLKADDTLCLTGYDLKKGIYTNIEADVEQVGEIVVNAKLFNEMIRRMPDGIIEFTTQNSNIHLRCGKSEFNFIGISADDFPEISTVDTINEISMPEKILKSMINQTSFAVSDNEIRPIYTGILFEVEDDTLTLVAVDGYRLAKRCEKIENGQMENCSFVVPGATLSDVERICSDRDNLVNISVGERHISFTIGNTVIISRRLEGEFLNYRKSIPESFKYSLCLERVEFLNSIDRVSLIVNEKNSSPVRLTMNDGSMHCMCITPIGKAEDVCLCDGNGEGMEIGFNDRYLTEALKAASGKDKIMICLNSPSSPCIIKAADETDNFTYMILPVRLRAAD